MRDEDIDALMAFPNIVHHRPKLEAIVAQAKGYIQIEQDYDSFSSFYGHLSMGHRLILNINL